MAMFKGFKPQGLQKIASKMGYAGRMEEFDNYLEQNPEKQREMITYSAKAQEMARGGVVRKMAVGGQPTQSTPTYTPAGQAYVPTLGTGTSQVDAYGDVPTTTYDEEGNATATTTPAGLTDTTTALAQTGGIPVGAVTQPQLTPVMGEQLIDSGTGTLGTSPTATASQATTSTADTPSTITANTYDAAKASDEVQAAIQANTAAQTNATDANAKVVAAQQTASSVSNITAAQGNSIVLNNPTTRKIQTGELVDGIANAETASAYTEQVQAATSTASEQATVAGQLATLTANFDASNPPAWAAGTLRAVQAQMAARGLGASSMAGQAMIQGALESALPIAQADSQTVRTFELQNLTNRQQRAMLSAQQRATFIGQEFDQGFQARVQNSARIADIANKNFTAEQSIALENSKNANTMNLNNLANNQAVTIAEAAALSQMDTANLNARQQAAVSNASNFLQLDMANLSNEQQTSLYNAQAINQSLLTDQAATNAASQFNSTSANQTNQFMSNLANQVSQFNSTQANAQEQFNSGETNAMAKFNNEVLNQRDQFNAQNQIAIAQNNAVWRREIATADTAAINRANELNAKAVLDVSNTQYNNLWSFFSDTMEWAWKSAEGEQDRISAIAIAEISKESQQYLANATKSAAGKSALGTMIGTLGGLALKYDAFG